MRSGHAVLLHLVQPDSTAHVVRLRRAGRGPPLLPGDIHRELARWVRLLRVAERRGHHRVLPAVKVLAAKAALVARSSAPRAKDGVLPTKQALSSCFEPSDGADVAWQRPSLARTSVIFIRDRSARHEITVRQRPRAVFPWRRGDEWAMRGTPERASACLGIRNMNWLRASCLLLVASLLVAAVSCGSSRSNGGFPGPEDDASAGSASNGGSGGRREGTTDRATRASATRPARPGQQRHRVPEPAVPGAPTSLRTAASRTTLTRQGVRPGRAQPALQRRRPTSRTPRAASSTPSPSASAPTRARAARSSPAEPDRLRRHRHLTGNFTLTNVPDGTNIPLVVQIGKWRKEIIIPTVTPCSDNARRARSRCPRTCSDGLYASMPNIAVSTGGADTLECLLTRVGVDEGDVHGRPERRPACTSSRAPAATPRRGSRPSPAVALGQPGRPHALRHRDALVRGLADDRRQRDDRRRTWRRTSRRRPRVRASTITTRSSPGQQRDGPAYPQFPNIANWTNLGLAGNDSPVQQRHHGRHPDDAPERQAVPRGRALKSWLGNVGALNAGGEIVVPAANARDTALVRRRNVATPWVQTGSGVDARRARSTSRGTCRSTRPSPTRASPSTAGARLQRHARLGIGRATTRPAASPCPAGCDAASTLSPDEDAIEFILFDLSSCVTPVGFTPPAAGPRPAPSSALRVAGKREARTGSALVRPGALESAPGDGAVRVRGSSHIAGSGLRQEHSPTSCLGLVTSLLCDVEQRKQRLRAATTAGTALAATATTVDTEGVARDRPDAGFGDPSGTGAEARIGCTNLQCQSRRATAAGRPPSAARCSTPPEQPALQRRRLRPEPPAARSLDPRGVTRLVLCDSLYTGDPIATALTDAGRQLHAHERARRRRTSRSSCRSASGASEITVPTVAACTTTPIAGNAHACRRT